MPAVPASGQVRLQWTANRSTRWPSFAGLSRWGRRSRPAPARCFVHNPNPKCKTPAVTFTTCSSSQRRRQVSCTKL